MEYNVEVTLKARHTTEQLEELLDRLTAEGTIRGPVVMGWPGAIGVFGQVEVDGDDPRADGAVYYAQMALADTLGLSAATTTAAWIEAQEWVTLSAQPMDWPLPVQRVGG